MRPFVVGELSLFIRPEDNAVVDSSGVVYEIREAILAIPWVQARMYVSTSPHDYIVQARCPVTPWAVLSCAIARHPESYRAYWRGYRTANRYLDMDGRRYWRTSAGGPGGFVMMLNRSRLEDAEPPRRVDQGAKPAESWSGPPWELDGTPWPAWYVQGADGVFRYRMSLDPFRRRSGKPTA